MADQVWKPYKWWASDRADAGEIQFRFWEFGGRWPDDLAAWQKAAVGNAGMYMMHRSDVLWAWRPYCWNSDRTALIWLNASIALEAMDQGKPVPHGELLAERSKDFLKKFFEFLVGRNGGQLSAVRTERGVLVSESDEARVEFVLDLHGVKMPWTAGQAPDTTWACPLE
jgi:hypothetical protein